MSSFPEGAENILLDNVRIARKFHLGGEPENSTLIDRGYEYFSGQFFWALSERVSYRAQHHLSPFSLEEAEGLAAQYDEMVPRVLVARQILEANRLEQLELWMHATGGLQEAYKLVLADYLRSHAAYKDSYFEDDPEEYVRTSINCAQWLYGWLTREQA